MKTTTEIVKGKEKCANCSKQFGLGKYCNCTVVVLYIIHPVFSPPNLAKQVFHGRSDGLNLFIELVSQWKG